MPRLLNSRRQARHSRQVAIWPVTCSVCQCRKSSLGVNWRRRVAALLLFRRILVNAPTLDGWYLLRGQAGAMSRTTGIHALLFSGLSRREGARGEVGVAPNLVVLAVALTALGLFAAIYHPVGTAMLIQLLASR